MSYQSASRNDGRKRGRFVPRFAGEAFAHDGNPDDGPIARKLTSTIAWKQPPSASVKAEVST